MRRRRSEEWRSRASLGPDDQQGVELLNGLCPASTRTHRVLHGPAPPHPQPPCLPLHTHTNGNCNDDGRDE